MLVAASLMGCMEFLEMASTDVPPPSEVAASSAVPRRSETTAVTVRVAGPLTVASAKGSHADITSVTVTVARVDSQGTPLEAPLAPSDDGSWAGTLSGLAVDTPLTFTAQALDSESTVIFNGTHTATLGSVGAQITIRLNAVDDNVANRFPNVTGISISNVSTGVPADVSITVQGSGTEQLHYELTGGTFDPSSGEITLSAGAETLTSSYTPPDVPGWYTVQIALRNAQGNRVEVDFQIRVQTAGLTAKLGPVVQGITGKRTPAGVRWTAAVSAAGDGTGLSYAWSFTGTETFTDSAENPTILTSYTQTTAGTLSVTVTDAAGLTASASLEVTAEMFPVLDLMPAAATLLVNEVDYDQSGSSDAAEFIEILNPGQAAVDLADYRFELVDGADDEPYLTYEPVRTARRRWLPGDRGSGGHRRTQSPAGRYAYAGAHGNRHPERPGRRPHRGEGGRARRGCRPLRRRRARRRRRLCRSAGSRGQVDRPLPQRFRQQRQRSGLQGDDGDARRRQHLLVTDPNRFPRVAPSARRHARVAAMKPRRHVRWVQGRIQQGRAAAAPQVAEQRRAHDRRQDR